MRGAAHRILPALGGLLLVGWGVSYVTRPTPAEAFADSGTLARADSTLAGPWQPLAMLEGEALEGGRILAVDFRGDTLVLAHPHAVSIIVNGTLRHRFGSDVVGAPEFIARGAGIALTAQGIAVLDAPQHRLDYWSPDGQRLARVMLPTGRLGGQYGAMVSLDSAVLVTAFRHSESAAGWWVWRVTPTTMDTLVACHACGAPGAAFRIPQVAAGPGGYVLLDALTGVVLTLDAQGVRRDSTQRPAHPRYAVPESARRRVAQIAATMPEALRRTLDVGDYAPSTRAIDVTADGGLILLTANLEDATHVEILAGDARPIGRLWAEPEAAQVFLVRQRVIRLREDGERYVFDQLSLAYTPR